MSKKKILVVDDEVRFTQMIKLNLEAGGKYDVKIENNAAQAVKVALEMKPDLILLDVIMPETEGPDVVCQLREHDILKKIPVIFLTATVTKEEVEAQQGRIGGHAFLAKPGSVDDLIFCIEQHLANAR